MPRSSTREDHGIERGFAALVAPGVRNSGTITATGTVALASGNSFTLELKRCGMVGHDSFQA
jgi:hypothetical protein